MSAKITEAQKLDLLTGIAEGRPMGELAGLAGVSTPTITNKLSNPAFLAELVALFTQYDEGTRDFLAELEHWWNRPGERTTAYQLRHRVARLIREKFAAEDEAEQEAARRSGGYLRRGGIDWKWDRLQRRWTYGANWWRGSIGG